MRRVTLRSIWTHKRRLISTVVAIVLGVAFMSGTAVFADTLNKVFDDLFAQLSEGVDARVQGEVLFDSDEGDQRARLDESVIDTVADVDGVAAVAPQISTFGGGAGNRVLGSDGEPIGSTNGPPTILSSWIDDGELAPYDLRDGRAPEADDEVVLNVAAADDGDYDLGDTVTIVTQFGPVEYTLVGTITYGDNESSAGAVSAELTLAEAQHLAGGEGEVDNLLVRADDGIGQQELVDRLAPVVPDAAEVITGEEAAEQDADSIQDNLAFFSQILTIFGFIALLVGTFIIANTFQILVAQRTRELALLRAVGASRAQVLRSVLLEAVVIGIVSALLGIVVGIGLAIGVTAIMRGAGIDFPSGDLVVSPATFVNGLVIGLIVTVAAAISPAIRATRVPPLAALRDVAVEGHRTSKLRLGLGIVAFALGAFDLSQAWGSDGDTDVLPTVGLGALLLIVAAIVIGPALAGRTVRAIGAPLPRLRGITGRLATENAARSPKRTSATASALLIGVALIGFITVFASSAKASVRHEFGRIGADIFVQQSGGFGPGFSGFSPAVADAVADVDGMDVVTSFAGGAAEVTYPDGDTASSFIGAIDPEPFGELTDPDFEVGSLDDLTPGTVFVDRQVRNDHDLELGDVLHFTLPSGRTLDLTISAFSDDNIVFGPPWMMHLDTYREAFDQPDLFQVFASVDDGADVEAVRARAEAAVEGFPALDVLDRQQFQGTLEDQLSAFVNVIYGLLFLSILIAMIGVANTISLSVHERTRELGLLRAVGMARRQLRAAIRWEAVLIAVLGGAVGLLLGLVTSYAMVKALGGFGLTTFSVPYTSLVFQLGIAAAIGVVASILPARRAAKLDILQAIATN